MASGLTPALTSPKKGDGKTDGRSSPHKSISRRVAMKPVPKVESDWDNFGAIVEML